MGYESQAGAGMDQLEALFGGPEPEPLAEAKTQTLLGDVLSDAQLAKAPEPRDPQTMFPEDIRLWPKDKAVWNLWRSEHMYLGARGWIPLIGIRGRFMIKPGDDPKSEATPLYSHLEALRIQKEADGMLVDDTK